jgi:CHAT domain-containing protein
MKKLRIRMRWRKVLLHVLATSNPTLNAALPDSNNTRDIEAMRANLPFDTIAIVYSLVSASPTGLMTLVVTSNGVEEALWLETNVLVIQKQIAHLRDSMNSRSSRVRDLYQFSPTSSRRDSIIPDLETLESSLSATLVLPIRHFLEGKKRLIIIPSGDLAHVPWTMFFDLPVTVVPSLSIWNRLHSHSSVPRPLPTKVSVVSNAPRNEQGFLRDIPYSRMEAFYVAKLHQQLPFISDNHGRAEFDKEAESTQVLHLCAHSSFDHEDPMRSSIQLFKEPLTILEWHSLVIKADLVVFSSCLSGISKSFDSGSTFGFAHTLLATGTRAFIGSLWPVDDDATLLLMMMFYEDLRRSLSPAQALHNAQQKMKNMTEDMLFDLVMKLKLLVKDVAAAHYVAKPNFWVGELEKLPIEELREARCWAAFVLTGYGFKPIYGSDTEPETTPGAYPDDQGRRIRERGTHMAHDMKLAT